MIVSSNHPKTILVTAGSGGVAAGFVVAAVGGLLLTAHFFPHSFLGALGNLYNLYTGPSIIGSSALVEGVSTTLIFIGIIKKKKVEKTPLPEKLPQPEEVKEPPSPIIAAAEKTSSSSTLPVVEVEEESSSTSSSVISPPKEELTEEEESSSSTVEEESEVENPLTLAEQRLAEVKFNSDSEEKKEENTPLETKPQENSPVDCEATLSSSQENALKQEQRAIERWFVYDSEDEKKQDELLAKPQEEPPVDHETPQPPSQENVFQLEQPVVVLPPESKDPLIDREITPLPSPEEMEEDLEVAAYRNAAKEKEELPSAEVAEIVSQCSLSVKRVDVSSEEEDSFPEEAFIQFFAAIRNYLRPKQKPERAYVKLLEQKLNEKTPLTPTSKKFIDEYFYSFRLNKSAWVLAIDDTIEEYTGYKVAEEVQIKKELDLAKKKRTALSPKKIVKQRINKFLTKKSEKRILKIIAKHYEAASDFYPPGSVRRLVEKIAKLDKLDSPEQFFSLMMSLYGLLPFFMGIYKKLGAKRKEIPQWIISLTSKLLDKYLRDEANEFPEMKPFLPQIKLIKETVFQGISLFNFLFDEKSEGDAVLRNCFFYFHQVLVRQMEIFVNQFSKDDLADPFKFGDYRIGDGILKYQEEEGEKGISIFAALREDTEARVKKSENIFKVQNTLTALFKTFVWTVSPLFEEVFIAYFHRGDFDKRKMATFLSELEEIEGKVSENFLSFDYARNMGPPSSLERHALPPIVAKDLVGFGKLIDTVFGSLREIATTTSGKVSSFYESSHLQANYAGMQREGEKVLLDFMGYWKHIFGDSVQSLGEYAVKSTLLAKVMPQAFATAKERKKLLNDMLEYLLSFLERGKVDTKEMKIEIDKLIALIENDFIKDDPLQQMPYHDFPLLLLLAIFGVRHFVDLHPFLVSHQEAIVGLMKELPPGVQENWGLELEAGREKLEEFISFLGKPTKALNTSVPFKGTLMNTGLEFISKKLEPLFDDLEIGKNKREVIVKIVFPILRFLLVGSYGKGWITKGKAVSALQDMENKLIGFVRHLYSFNMKKVDRHSSYLPTHCKTSLEDFLHPPKKKKK